MNNSINTNVVGEFERESGYLLVSPGSKTQPKPPRPYQITILLIALTILMQPIIGSLSLSSEPFSMNIEYDQNSLSFIIKGPPNTPFNLQIIDSEQVVFERTASTNFGGSYNLFIPAFKDGKYVAILRSGTQTIIKEFELLENNILTTTLTSTSSITTTVFDNQTTTNTTTTVDTTTTMETTSSTKEEPIFIPKGINPIESIDGLNLGLPQTETVKSEKYNISAYDTKIELVSHHSSPVSQKIAYRIFNKRNKDYSYVAVATSGELKSFNVWHLINETKTRYYENVTYYEGDVREQFRDAPVLEYVPFYSNEIMNEVSGNFTKVGYPYNETYTYETEELDQPELLWQTSNFLEKWNSGWFDSIKSYLSSNDIVTDLSVLDSSVLPEPEQEVYIYRVPHAPNSWEYFEYETDNKPSKFLAFDPAGGSWWNETWNYRKGINITNNEGSVLLQNYSIKLTIDHASLVSEGKSLANGNDIRITWWNGTNEIELDRVNETAFNTSSTQIWFKLQKNISASGYDDQNYTIYYGNPSAGSPPVNRSKVYLWFDDFNRADNPDITTEAAYKKYNGGTWAIVSNQLRNTGAAGDPNKLVVETLGNVTSDVDMLIKLNVTTWLGTADTGRMGLSCCMDDMAGGGYCSLFHNDQSSLDLLNDGRDWGTLGSYSWSTNTWYYMRFQVIVPSSLSGRTKVWRTDETEPSTWTVDGNFGDGPARGYGEVGIGGSRRADITYFDDFQIRYIKTTEPSASLLGEENAALINVTIDLPQQNSQKTRLNPFTMNGTVNCTRGNCEDVSANAQYYSIATPTYTWTETSTSDFSTYNESVNVTISGGTLALNITNPGAPWWDNSYYYRKRLNITNGNNTINLITGYSVNYTFNHSALVSSSKSLLNGSDVRVVYWDNSTLSWTELDRVNETAFNTSSTQIWFKLQKNISASDYDNNYYVYYGNPSAGSPPANKSNVYLWFDDFNRADNPDITTEAAYKKYNGGTWAIVSNQLRNTGAAGDPNKLVVETLGTVSYFVDMKIKMNVTTWLGTADEGRMGLSCCMDNAAGGGYNGLFHNDQSSLDLLNDQRSWGTLGSYSWSTNTWYYMRFSVMEPSTRTGRVKVWQVGSAEPSAWTVDGSFGTGTARGYGEVGIGGSRRADVTYFDDFLIRYAMGPEPTVSEMGTEQELNVNPSGYYVSNSLDSGSSDVQYQNIYWSSYTNANTTIKVYTRSSLDNSTWSNWFQEVNDTTVDAPNRRYIQYKIEMNTVNSKQTPYFYENDIVYKISTAGWTNMTSGTALSANNPYGCGLLNQSNPLCYPIWSVTPKQVGDYSVRIYAGSPANGTSETRNITVMADTYVTDFTSNQSIVGKGRSVELTARLLDDESQPMEGYNITFWDETFNDTQQKYYIGSDFTDSNGYAYVTYSVPQTAKIGTHTLNASYNGSSVEYLNPDYETTTLDISSVPYITNVSAEPNVTGFGYNVTLNANVTDEVGVNSVIAYVTYPNSTQTSLVMTNNTKDIYKVNFTDTWQTGTYSYYIYANNTDGISNSSETKYFYVNVSAQIEVVTENDTYKALQTVYLSDRPQSWWNYSFSYRIPVQLTNSISLAKTDEPITVFVDFSNPAYNNSVRVVNENGQEIPSQTWNIISLNSTHMDSANVTFLANVSASSTKTYYIYYDGQNVGSPNYQTSLNVTLSGNYIYFNTSKIYGRYSIDQDSGTTADDDGAFQSFRVFNGTAWNEIMGDLSTLHQGIDRFDYAGYGGGGGVNLDWTLYTIENGTLFKKYKLNATDTTTSTNYTIYLTFYDKSKYAEVRHEATADSIQVYDLAGITAQSGDNIWVDDSNQGLPSWTDAKYATQPTKYISYLRNSNTWGVSFINPPPDGNPSDGNSFEIGLGIDSGVTGLRIDGRGTGEQNVNFPYTFYLAGIKSGNSEVNETWNIINNATQASVLSEEEKNIGLKNTGNMNFKGYLWMIVQTNVTGTWENLMPPVVNDLATETVRTVNVSSILNLSKIWEDGGAWYTDRREPGWYRVNASLKDPYGNVLIDYDLNSIEDVYEFKIVESILKLTELEHENQYDHSINEYEVEDKIDWINVTVTALNSTALSTNITLNLLDQSKQQLSWGPNETKECGDIPEGQSCERRWDNATFGYPIPLTASTGTYTFYWNVSMILENGNTSFNDSLTFKIHNIPNTFSSNLSTTRIYKPGWTWYNFTFNNSWNSSLSNVNVTINCPNATEFSCSCALPGQSGPTCNITSVDAYEKRTIPFNVSVTNNTPNGNYNLNVTMNYTNPGGETRQWNEKQNKVLEIREYGILEITTYQFPTNVTRGETIQLKAYINNTNASTAHNVWFNYTLPSGWTNTSGVLKLNNETLCAYCILWNNITVNVGSSSVLGANEVRLDSESQEGQVDWKIQNIDVYSNTTIIDFQPSDSTPNVGETIQLQAKLRYDNGSSIANENVTFWDQTEDKFINSSLTNSMGIATVSYTISGSAPLGTHILNATYYGSSVKYTRPSSNTTTINVGMPPNITNISATPQNVGYGYNVTIQANVTDADGISKVFAKVTYPNGTLTTLEMTNYTKDIYKVNFTDTWQYGTHSYYIWANDTTNGVTQSSTYYFYVKAKGKVYVKTLNDSYDPNQYVNLTEHGDDSWWNFSWKYKIPVNITEKSGKDLTDYQINITLNTQTLIQQGKMQSYCNDTRVIYYNATSNNYTELSYWINNCNTTSTNIWTKVPYIPANGNSTVYVYYGNPSAQSKSNATTTFEFFDNFSSLSQWTIRSGDESYMRLNNTLGNPLPSLQHIPNPGTGNGDTRGRGTDFKIENATIEYDIYLEGTGRTIHQFFFRTDSLSFNSGYAYRLQTSAADGGWFEFSGGSWSQIGTARPAVSGNTWHHVKLSFAGNNLTAWVDGGSADSVLDSTKLTSDYIGSHTHGTSGWLYDLVDNIIVRKYASTEPNVSVGSENYSGSAVSNDGNVSFKGYLLMTVQKYSGTWQTISVRINDTNTSTIRTIENLSALNIGYLWNQNPWYTDLQGEGTYRVYAALTNPKGNVLNSDLGYLNNTYNFTINPSPVQINIINITIYNVTDNLNPHTYTGDLEDFGTNKTFTLYSGETYRVEIKVNNTGSATWYINNSNISHTNLNSIWQLNATEDIWYSNISERSDTSFTGGNWSAGNVKWNSSLGGIVPAGKNATFYYVFNVTSSQTENRLVNFRIEEPTFIKNDYSTYHIVIAESVPPFLYQEIYGITNVNVTRGNSTKVYARWNETIGQAKAEYNSTTPTLINYTISPPFTGNWTNYTISTTSIWLLGNHSVKIYASDEQGNWNGTLSYLNFKVWGMAEVTSGSLNSSTINVSDTVKIECQVKDTTNNTAIPNYVVSFYNSTNLLGTNTTNSTGWAFHTYTDNSPGTETIVCNVTENENYKINQNNYKQMTLTTKEYEAPKYWDVNDNVTGIVHKTDYVELRTRWTDNYQLSKAVLSTNASGWSNVSYKNLTGAQDWANFTYQIPASMQPGYLAWRQYANDTFNNQNVTNVTSETIIEVWGWSKISEAYLSNKFIYTGNSTTMFCRVVDSNSSSAIGNYPVSFYNSTHLLGTNYTNSTGWSWWNFTDNSNGVETIICNITHNSTLMYNASENNQGSDSLTTSSPGEDITPPFLFNEIYGLNKTTDVMRGESVKAYALWNETISNATIEYNSTNLSTDTYIISGPYTNNWTNYTMTTNSSWSLGLHVVKIRAADPYSNWNTSLTYKTFELWGRSGVYWQMPTGQVNRTVMNLTCYVRDIDTNQPINGYTVYFYDAESYLGWSSTNSSGYAVYQWDASNEDVGPEQMTCSISDDSGKYYKANISSDSETLTIMGKLNTTILAPQNGNEFKKGDTIGLNSTTVDEKGQSVTPTATWYNSTNQIASGENTTWQIPLGHSVGDEMIRIQTTKQYYYSDTKNVTIYVWGWSRITWIAPNDGMHKQNEDIDLICRVTDSNSSSGINNYPVNFYRDDNFLFTNYTNSTGYARYRWNTDSFTGQIVLSCNITDNSTLYYNASQNYEDNTTIQIDTTPPMVENETRWHPSVIHYNETINLTVDVIDSNLDKVWVRLGRPKSSYINVSMNNMTLNRYNLTSSKYSYELGVWNATFFANDTANNQNQSATTLAWEVWGWSEANWTSPEGGNYSQGTIIPLTCQVKDSNTTTGIQNYSVNFYVKNSTDTISLGSNLTNSTGYATKNWDTTAYAQGTYYPKCNITHNSTLYYNVTQNFEDNTTLNITGVAGKLIVALNEPLDNTIVPRYRNFTINATVICKDANCGVVQGRARYNSSGTEPNTDISTAPGTTPFYTFDSNPQSCGTLNQDQNCTLIWKVNSTGSLDSYYNIDVLFSNPSNDTTNSLIRIGLVLVLNVSTDTINWGNLDPNINGTSAPANPYQVGLDKNSNDASGLYIMGTNLVGSTSTPIEVSNISWCKECSGYLTSTRLNNTYQLIQSNPPSGVNYNTYFWLDTPPVYYGYYSGLVTIMANTSW